MLVTLIMAKMASLSITNHGFKITLVLTNFSLSTIVTSAQKFDIESAIVLP